MHQSSHKMNAFFDDIKPMIKKFEELLGLSFKVFLVTSILVIFLGVYVANLIFGESSLKVLQHLRTEKRILQTEIDTLKKENARLHKEYLEWTDAQ